MPSATSDEPERVGARRHADRVAAAGERGELGFERGELGAEEVRARPHDAVDGVGELGLERARAPGEVDDRDALATSRLRSPVPLRRAR